MNQYTRNYQDFPFAVELYDYVAHQQLPDDIDFWLEYAGRAKGPALELGCGTGRVLIPLARAGVEVTGLDISPLMLDACRRKLASEPAEVRKRVTLVEGSMHEFRLGREFALVFSAFRSFQILDSLEHQLSCLACAREHLRDGGLLILDVFDPYLPYLIGDEYKQEHHRSEPFALPDGRSVAMATRNPGVDQARQTIDCELIYYVTHPDGREDRLVQAFTLRYLFRYELEHLLVRAGFEIEDIFGGFDKSPFGQKRPGEIIAVARKR